MGALWGHHPKPSTTSCPWGRAMRPGHPRVTHGKIYISSITGCFGDAWRENSGVVQDEAPSPPWLTPNLNEPPRRHLWRTLILTHSSQIPSPHRPPNPGAPRAWHRRGGRWWRWQPWWWHGARPPPASPGTRDRAAAAGARSRNGHGWAGTAAPRLRARGQQQLELGFVLDESPRGRPGTKPPPPRPPPCPPRLITSMAPRPRRAGVRLGRPNPMPREDPRRWASASCRWHPPGGGGRGSRLSPPSGWKGGREGGKEAGCIPAGTSGSVCYKCILELFIKVAKNLC